MNELAPGHISKRAYSTVQDSSSISTPTDCTSCGQSYTRMRFAMTPAAVPLAETHIALGPGAPGGGAGKEGYPYAICHAGSWYASLRRAVGSVMLGKKWRVLSNGSE
jgi:hypothetical protein